MKATINHNEKGFMIVVRDDTGNTVDRIVVSEIVLEGEPWAKFQLAAGNRLRMVGT